MFLKSAIMDRKVTISNNFIEKHREIIVCLFLVIAILIAYLQVKNHAFLNYDDVGYVTENSHVQSGLNLKNIFWAFSSTSSGIWHPLTWLSHMLDCQIYGMKSGWHHITNLLFHTANTLILFIIFRKMTSKLWQSAFIAIMFALHPIHVESVAWVSERKDVLSTFFWILTIWSYVKYVEYPRISRYMLVILFFILGLMSKPMLVTLPFVLLLLDYWPLGRFRFGYSDNCNKSQKILSTMSIILEKIPFLFFSAALSVVAIFTQNKEGALAPLDVYSLKVRIANALVSYINYIGKMLWPSKLAILYPHQVNLPWWKVTVASLLLALISFLVIIAIRKKPYIIVGWLWYIGTLIPVIGLVQIGGQSMADRYTYIPLIGLFIIIGWGTPELVARWRYRKILLFTTSTIVILILMTITWKQVKHWKNNITLFENTLKVTSNNFKIHTNLGTALYNQGKVNEATIHLLEALRINPDYALTHSTLGVAFHSQGKIDKAIYHYSEALRIKSDDPLTHYNLGIVLHRQGKIDKAIYHYSEVLRIKPDFEKAHNNLGVALLSKGDQHGAIYHFREAVRIKPDYIEAKNNLKSINIKD